MSRKAIDAAIRAKLETTYGVDAVTAAANALEVNGQTVEDVIEYVKNETIRNYGGGHEDLVGAIHRKLSLGFNIFGAGAAGTAPVYGTLLRSCMLAETISAGVCVEYTPVTAGEESATIDYYDSGVLKKLLGFRGDWELNMTGGQKPEFKINGLGLDGGIITATPTPSDSLAAWTPPLVVTNPNTGDLLIGCTYASGVLSGGTAYPSKGLTLKSAHNPVYDGLLGGEAINVERKDITGSITLELTAAQEVTFEGYVRNGTKLSMGLAHGTTAGGKFTAFCPSVQLKNPKRVVENGVARMSYEVLALPTSAGNNDVTFAVL